MIEQNDIKSIRVVKLTWRKLPIETPPNSYTHHTVVRFNNGAIHCSCMKKAWHRTDPDEW